MENLQQVTQRKLIFNGLALAALGALVFFNLHHPSYDTRIYGLGLIVFVGLMALLRWRKVSIEWAAHAMFATAWVLVTWAMVFTGGVLSTKMVWFGMLMPAAFLVLPARHAWAWAVFFVLTILTMAALTLGGVIAPPALLDATHVETVWWSWFNRVQVLCMMLVCVHLYRYQHRRATAVNEARNQELEDTSRKLQQAQAHKDAFLAAVGHELRTPMNAILGLNGLLRSHLAHEPSLRDVVDLIRSATEQLLQVVNHILDFSRLQAHRLQLVPEPLALDALLETCIQNAAESAQSKGLSLRLLADDTQGIWVQTDGQRLQQIIGNLLDNAIKFSSQGVITLRVSRVQNRHPHWRFEVQDNGIGIAQERQAHIFHRFEHADTQTNRLYGGTGLGLAICDQLVRLFGGDMGVQSTVGQGALFWFVLPLPDATPPAALSKQELNELCAQPWRILLVDDNELNRVVATLLLKKILPHVQLHASADAQDALSRLAHEPFDLVLMDIIMPNMDGMSATRALRAQAGPNAQTPVLAMTAINQPEDRAACLAAGMNGMVCKPLRASELMHALGMALAKPKAPPPYNGDIA